jgi:hypothetical protein
VYDASGTPQPLLEERIAAGGTCGRRPCWRPIGATGYRYRNKTGTPDGVTDVRLKVTEPGELQLAVKGKGAPLALPPLGLATPVTVALLVDDPQTATCWQATFVKAVRNDPTAFKGAAP